MPKTQITHQYGWFPTTEERAYDQSLEVHWMHEVGDYTDGFVNVGLRKRYVKEYAAGSTDIPRIGQAWVERDGTTRVVVRTEEEKIGLSRREINNLIGDLKRARRQAFGEDK
jgi:hypothetical protein